MATHHIAFEDRRVVLSNDRDGTDAEALDAAVPVFAAELGLPEDEVRGNLRMFERRED